MFLLLLRCLFHAPRRPLGEAKKRLKVLDFSLTLFLSVSAATHGAVVGVLEAVDKERSGRKVGGRPTDRLTDRCCSRYMHQGTGKTHHVDTNCQESKTVCGLRFVLFTRLYTCSSGSPLFHFRSRQGHFPTHDR